MASNAFTPPKVQFIDTNTGDPASGYKVYFYESGTTTLQTVYTDAGKGTAHSNPVVLDQNGRETIHLIDNTKYTVALVTPTGDPGSPVWTEDNVVGLQELTQTVVGAALFPETTAETSAAVTPTNLHYPDGRFLWLNVLRYGADASGSTDSTSAINDAISVLEQNSPEDGGVLFFPAGEYQITSTIEIPRRIVFRGDGRFTTRIKAGSGFSGTAGIRLGKSADTAVLGCRLEDLAVDTTVTTSINSVYSNAVNEQSGLVNVALRTRNKGFYVDSTGSAKNFMCHGVEVFYPDESLGSEAVGLDLDPDHGPQSIINVTVNGPEDFATHGKLVAAVWYRAGAGAFLSGVHCEGCTKGLRIGDNTGGSSVNGFTAINISGDRGAASVDDLVHIENTSSQNYALFALDRGMATNTLVDNANGSVTETGARLSFRMVGGGSAGARTIISSVNGRTMTLGGSVTLDITGTGKLAINGSDILTHQALTLQSASGSVSVNAQQVLGARESAVGSLTDSTGGTANGTLAAVSSTGDDATINDNFADIAEKVNAILSAIGTSGHGLTAD